MASTMSMKILQGGVFVASIVISFTFYGYVWNEMAQGQWNLKNFQQQAWRWSPKSLERGGTWIDTGKKVYDQYVLDCSDAMVSGVGNWPAEMFDDDFCTCVARAICNNNISTTDAQTVITQDARMDLIECQIRDKAEKSVCTNNCGVNGFNIGFLGLSWNHVSLSLALELFVGMFVGSQTNMIWIFTPIQLFTILIYYIPIYSSTESWWDLAVFATIPWLYFIVKSILFALPMLFGISADSIAECYMTLMDCNATYHFTVPLSIAVLYAANFILDGKEALTAILASLIVPLTQLLLSAPGATKEGPIDKTNKALLLTCSIIASLTVLMPQFYQFMTSCEASRPQFWSGLSTWIVWSNVLVNTLYPVLEQLYKMVMVRMFSTGAVDCWSLSAFFVFMDLLTRCLIAAEFWKALGF